MKKFNKVLLAIEQPEFNCYGPKNTLLYVANEKDSKKPIAKLRSDSHFFVSLDGLRKPSEFGVVKEIEQPITAKELAQKDFESKNLDYKELNEEIIELYEKFLTTVSSQPVGTPMAVTWADKVFPKPQKYLKVHKVFFRDLTPEEKEELFFN